MSPGKGSMPSGKGLMSSMELTDESAEGIDAFGASAKWRRNADHASSCRDHGWDIRGGSQSS
jgi:hypothetical protein